MSKKIIGNTKMNKLATSSSTNCHVQCYYSTAQRQLEACTQAACSAPEGDNNMGMRVIFPVLSKACL